MATIGIFWLVLVLTILLPAAPPGAVTLLSGLLLWAIFN